MALAPESGAFSLAKRGPRGELAAIRMRRSPRNLRIACDHRGPTHFGGVYFFHEFLQLLQLRDFLARHLSYPKRNHRYSLSQMILALVYPVVLGLDRLETALF